MSQAPPVPVPRYGERSLADLVPSLLAAAAVPGFEHADVIGLGEVRRFCLLLIDALGWHQILDHQDVAPTLAAAAGATEPLTAGFPSTTAASLGSLGTGLTPGEHGLVGYTFAVPGHERAMNALLWELYGIGPHVDMRDELPPEQAQPHPTALERAALSVGVVRIGPPPHEDSGFTRAALRGGRYRGAYWLPDVRDAILDELAGDEARAVYAYHPDLDVAGHSRGVGSPEYLDQLLAVDALIADLAAGLPPGSLLAVTGDHGMVNLPDEDRLDADRSEGLLEGVRFLGGEARARHAYVRPGAAIDVLAAWKETLGDRMWVVLKEEAAAQGWFGPRVDAAVAPRIGDVVAAAYGSVGVFQKTVDPFQASLVGHHGSMTPAEQLVPLLLFRA